MGPYISGFPILTVLVTTKNRTESKTESYKDSNKNHMISTGKKVGFLLIKATIVYLIILKVLFMLALQHVLMTPGIPIHLTKCLVLPSQLEILNYIELHLDD